MTIPAEEPTGSGPGDRSRSVLLAIIATGVALRLAWCAYAARPSVGLHDPALYRLFAERIADGNGYTVLDGSPTAYFPIGYPFTLSVGFLVTPTAWQTAVIVSVNIAAQVSVTALTFAIARLLFPARLAPAAAAAAVLAAWPNLIVNSAVALTESLFTALALGCVYLVLRSLDNGVVRPSRLLLIGAILGFSVLVRPVSPLLVAVFAVVWLVSGVPWKHVAGRVGLIAVGVILVVSPWLARNAVVMDAAVLSTNAGDNLCMSRRVDGSGGFEFPNTRCNSGPFDGLPRPAYETERDAHGRRLAWEFVRDHPVEEARHWVRRLRYALWWDDDGVAAVESYGEDRFLGDGLRRAVRLTSNGYYYVMVAVGLFGLGRLAWSRRAGEVAIVLSPIALLIPVMLTFGDPRFKIPILPFLALGVGTVVDAIWQRASSRARGTLADP